MLWRIPILILTLLPVLLFQARDLSSAPPASQNGEGEPAVSVMAPVFDPEQDSPPQPDPDPAAEPAARPDYDFSAPVPQSEAVDRDYFADAAFVGDSRTEGFWLFSGIKQGTKLTCDGLSVFTLTEKKALTIDGTSYTLLEALALQDYGKVYLCLGINELGYRNDQHFYEEYCRAIDAVRACQPNAVLYVQTLIPLNEAKVAASGGFDYLKNDHLRRYNELIRQAAAEKQVPLLDLYTHFAVDGQLPADASRDGVHLLPPYCKKQLEYFMTHTVSPDALYPPAPQAGPAIQSEVTDL